MHKNAVRDFAIMAREKLIADCSFQASLIGIGENAADPLPQSDGNGQFFAAPCGNGTGPFSSRPGAVSGPAFAQRRQLLNRIELKVRGGTSYSAARKSVIESAAYGWFNRLIALRFMEVNDYLPSCQRVLSPAGPGMIEPEMVTSPFASGLVFSAGEAQQIRQLQKERSTDALFRLLFLKQCHRLHALLPQLFPPDGDPDELLLNLSVVDRDGVVYRLVHDIPEEDFDVRSADENGIPVGQVEIIGWLSQYYNTALNETVYNGSLSRRPVEKELLPAATAVYTPDWPVRCMVQNSLGRLWLAGHDDGKLKKIWRWRIDDAVQSDAVQDKIDQVRRGFTRLRPKDLKMLDPCMGNGHVLVCAFELLMQIYESVGISADDAAVSIIENNLWGFDIDERASQLAYFSVLMKARQYSSRILEQKPHCHVYAIPNGNDFDRDSLNSFGVCLADEDRRAAGAEMRKLLDEFTNADEYGSLISVQQRDWELLRRFLSSYAEDPRQTPATDELRSRQRRLLNLVDVAEAMSSRYQVVVTSPPYLGSARFSPRLAAFIEKNYHDVRQDLSMAMYQKSLRCYLADNGFVSFITMSSWMALKRFEAMRQELLRKYDIVNMVDFGTELFDGKVGHNPIVTWTVRKSHFSSSFAAIRLVDYNYSRRSEKVTQFFEKKNCYYARPEDFRRIPGQPIAYWASHRLLEAFTYSTIGDVAAPRQGLATGCNDRFLRLWFEVPAADIKFDAHSTEEARASGKKWFPCNKGGSYRKWWGNDNYVVNWQDDGREIKNYRGPDGKLLSRPQNTPFYFRECFSWSKVSSGSIAFRFKPAGFIFEQAGMSCFCEKDLPYLLALANSNVAMAFLEILSPTMNYESGDIAKIPVIFDASCSEKISFLAQKCISLSREDWDSFETSWNFVRHPLAGGFKTVAEAFAHWQKVCAERFANLKSAEERLNRQFINIYGLSEEMSPQEQDSSVSVRRADRSRDIRSLISYAVGCMFGRWSLDCPGLICSGIGLEASKYSSFVPVAENIIPITDEEYFSDDIVSLFCSWMKAAYGAENLEENLNFIAASLGTGGDTARAAIRRYFLEDFFTDHCQTYQKRPLYWQLDSGRANGFKALIYAHRYESGVLARVRSNYLFRLQRHDDEELRRADKDSHSQDPILAKNALKRMEKLSRQQKECREFDERLRLAAQARVEFAGDEGIADKLRRLQGDGGAWRVFSAV